jgi:hypothetical protein
MGQFHVAARGLFLNADDTGRQRRSAIDARTTPHCGYGASQSRRAIIECIFGWGKLHGTMRKTRHRGIPRVAGDFLSTSLPTLSSASRNFLPI